MGYGRSWQRYLRRTKFISDIFGPLSSSKAAKIIPSTPGTTAICIGKDYKIKIPQRENYRYWSRFWNNQTVKAVGFLRLFYRGNPIVCVENNNKFLSLPSSWLVVIKKKSGCSCSTSTIWASGCQCGGS